MDWNTYKGWFARMVLLSCLFVSRPAYAGEWDMVDRAHKISVDTPQPVPDREPPSIRVKLVQPILLWPANHEMVDVSLDYSATDNSGKVTISLLIESNEPQSGLTGGDRFPDWEIVDEKNVRLRAERAPNQSGRLYTITIRAIDSVGNRAERYVRVTVPRSKPVDQRQQGWYNAEKEATNTDGDLACRVSPNPSNSFFDIYITSAASSDVISVKILDVTGKHMETGNLWNDKTIRVGQDLPRGIYYAELRQGDQMLRVQLTKQ